MADDPKKLTIEDPVKREVLDQLDGLQEAMVQLGQQMLLLEEEKIRILASSRRVREQRQRIFENISVERGITPGTPVQIDASTGKLQILTDEGVPVETAPVEPVPS